MAVPQGLCIKVDSKIFKTQKSRVIESNMILIFMLAKCSDPNYLSMYMILAIQRHDFHERVRRPFNGRFSP